ncbi:MAG: hypothetical protein ACLQSR_00445 [Limisphaerales bacterium]
MSTDALVLPEMIADKRLRLFSLYLDFAAAGRARWAAGRLSQLAGENQWESSAEMWSLDSLMAVKSLQKTIARDAARADVLIIAISSLEWREPKLTRWLDSLVAPEGHRRHSGLLIGLLGDEKSRAYELDWTTRQFLRCAQRTDRDFCWRWMDSEAMTDDHWLVDGVEALLNRENLASEAVFLQEAMSG